MDIIIASIEDKLSQCLEKSMLTSSAFLDPAQCAAAEKHFAYTKHLLYGGYDDAERRVMIFLPDYFDELPPEDDPLCVLHITVPKGGRRLTHRDYLGSLLSLGIDRSISGDIIVRDDGADIIILRSMANFLLMNYSRAGRTELTVSIRDISELQLAQFTTVEKKDTVASLRLDNLVSAAFNLSRSKAQEAVRSGLVFVNSLQCDKPDKELSEGDKFVLRGMGKAVLSEIGKVTRKDRIFITLTLYK